MVFSTKEVIQKIAEEHGTPFYLYDAHVLSKSFLALREALPKEVDIFYSIKANPNIALCSQLRKLGSCAELCSFYEIQAALKAGFTPENIIFVGPAKTDKEIVACLELGIYALVCESQHELKRISELARQRNITARVALRINPSHVSKTALLKMGGKPSQFGMDEEQVFNNKDYFISMPNIQIMGIHIYNGTRILTADTIVENTQYILELASRLSTDWQIKFEMIDIGGGLGIPYFDNEEELNINELKIKLEPIIKQYIANFPQTRIILESGRYLVATCGALVSRIVDIKHSKGEQFAITDGGTNCHMAAVGVGSFIKRNFPIKAVRQNENLSDGFEEYNITGPLCTPGDLIGKQVLLPTLTIGDFILVINSGAYGPTASPVMFLSHGFPAEILYQTDNFRLIRERFTEEEFLGKQYFINT